jgi:uncharacterized surface protein with fasciclin (FAS1) repeats
MKSMKIKTFLFLLAMSTFTACEDTFESPASPTGQTILEMLEADDNFNILVAALNKTGLAANLNTVNSGQFTLFAPDDVAMIAGLPGPPANEDAALTIIQNLTPTSTPSIGTIGQRLNYHLISSEIKASAITGTQTLSTLSTSTTSGIYFNVLRMSLSIAGADVLINGNTGNPGGKVTGADVHDAANGVVHKIDRFLSLTTTDDILKFLGLSINYTLTPPVLTGGLESGADATGTDYDLLGYAIRKSELAFVIQPNTSTPPDWTCFATNDATMLTTFFTPIDAGITTEALAIAYMKNTLTKEALADLLKYHFLPKRTLTADMTDELVLPTSLTGSNVTVDYVNPDYFIKDGNAAADPKVTSANTIRSNGVVHVINGVLRKN